MYANLVTWFIFRYQTLFSLSDSKQNTHKRKYLSPQKEIITIAHVFSLLKIENYPIQFEHMPASASINFKRLFLKDVEQFV